MDIQYIEHAQTTIGGLGNPTGREHPPLVVWKMQLVVYQKEMLFSPPPVVSTVELSKSREYKLMQVATCNF